MLKRNAIWLDAMIIYTIFFLFIVNWSVNLTLVLECCCKTFLHKKQLELVSNQSSILPEDLNFFFDLEFTANRTYWMIG